MTQLLKYTGVQEKEKRERNEILSASAGYGAVTQTHL